MVIRQDVQLKMVIQSIAVDMSRGILTGPYLSMVFENCLAQAQKYDIE